MAAKSRYRVEDGKRCVDIRLRRPQQLFDTRDPAPFRERDLDPLAVEHLVTAAGEVRAQFALKVVLHFSEMEEADLDEATLREAIRGHFEHECDLAERALSENFRMGRRLIVIGVLALGLLLTLAELSTKLPLGPLRGVVREGLTIMGWVALWRPVDVLLYEWIPLVQQRRRVRRILAAPVEVRAARASRLPDSLPAR